MAPDALVALAAELQRKLTFLDPSEGICAAAMEYFGETVTATETAEEEEVLEGKFSKLFCRSFVAGVQAATKAVSSR